MITQPPQNIPITKDGIMSDVFFNWVLNVSSFSTITGNGSPEGVVEAKVPRFYIQLDGAAGSKLWGKVLDDIAGDRSAGWELL